MRLVGVFLGSVWGVLSSNIGSLQVLINISFVGVFGEGGALGVCEKLAPLAMGVRNPVFRGLLLVLGCLCGSFIFLVADLVVVVVVLLLILLLILLFLLLLLLVVVVVVEGAVGDVEFTELGRVTEKVSSR